MPLVLAEYVSALAPDIGGSQSSLEIAFCRSQKKVGIKISGGKSVAVEVEFTVRVVIVDQVFLIRRKSRAKLPIAFPLGPRNCIGP